MSAYHTFVCAIILQFGFLSSAQGGEHGFDFGSVENILTLEMGIKSTIFVEPKERGIDFGDPFIFRLKNTNLGRGICSISLELPEDADDRSVIVNLPNITEKNGQLIHFDAAYQSGMATTFFNKGLYARSSFIRVLEVSDTMCKISIESFFIVKGEHTMEELEAQMAKVFFGPGI